MDNTEWNGKNTKHSRKIGMIGKYPIILDQFGQFSADVYLVNTEKKNDNNDFETVAQINMEVDWKADEKTKYWVTKSTMVSPFYQGKGLAPKMYAALCRKGMTLRSDDLQSAGGKKIWVALSKIPGITVYAGKRLSNGEWELSDIDNDVDDFLRSGFQTYDVEDQEDTNLLQKELKQYRDAAEKVGNNLVSIVKDPSKEAEADKLRAQIQDYQKVIDKIENEIHKNMNKQRNMESRDVYLFATATPKKVKESANQVKASEKMPKKQKPSKTGTQKHPYRGRLVGEDTVNELKIVTPHPKDTLGVPRRHMPQIEEDHYKALFKHLYANGVKVKKVDVDARDLDSTQSEFSDKGIEKSMTNGKLSKPIIISSDNYVLDGHHRWLAAKNGRKHNMTAFKLSVPAKEGLSLLINFPKATFKDIHESESIDGKQMLKLFYKMHHDAGNNDEMDQFILSHNWKLGNFTPDMFPSEEEFFDYDDPFDRIIDIDYGHRVDLSQPIIAGPKFSDGKFSVIDGNHRAASAQKMGKTIKAYFPVSSMNESIIFEANEDVRTFADQLEKKYDLQALFLSDLGERNAIEISSIIVKKENQRSGSGSAAMNEIIRYADQHGKILVLTPGLYDKRHGTTSQSRLTKFYKRFGFIENKGRNKNYEFRQSMIRYPQSNESVMTTEALNNPYPIRWSIKNKELWYAHAKEEKPYDQIGISIELLFNGVWDINFSVNDTKQKTGGGDQFKIFATVKAAIQEWWNWASKKADVTKITFSAEKIADESRSKLYQRFAKQFADAIGYNLTVKQGTNYSTFNIEKPEINEAAGVGKIVKGVNTTVDVGPNEIVKQAAKFGNKVSKDGKPARKLSESKNISDEQIEKIMNGRYEKVGLKLPSKYTLWRGVGNSGKGMASYGTGLYTTTSKKYASQFGKVVKMGSDALPDFPIRFNTINDYELWLQNAYKVLGFDGPREFVQAYNDVRHFIHGQLGFDGIQIGTGRDIMFVQYPLK